MIPMCEVFDALNKATIDTYRFRAMSSKSILHELIEVIQE
jgi:hypothetical protein